MKWETSKWISRNLRNPRSTSPPLPREHGTFPADKTGRVRGLCQTKNTVCENTNAYRVFFSDLSCFKIPFV